MITPLRWGTIWRSKIYGLDSLPDRFCKKPHKNRALFRKSSDKLSTPFIVPTQGVTPDALTVTVGQSEAEQEEQRICFWYRVRRSLRW